MTPEQANSSWLARLWARRVVLRRYWVAFGLVVGLALVMRAVHLIQVADSPFFRHLHTDPWVYNAWAEQIVAGDWLGARRPVFYLAPGYPYFLAVNYSLFGASPLAAAIVQVLLSALSAGLVYDLGRRLMDHETGLLAGVMAALYGMLIFFSSLLLGATLIILLNLLTLVMLASAMQRALWSRFALAGLCLGLAATARGSMALFVPLAVAAIIIHFGWRRWRQWLGHAEWFVAAFVLAISPVTLHNWVQGNDTVALTSNAGANLYIGNNGSADGIYARAARYKGRPMGLSVRDQKATFPKVARSELGRANLKPSEISAFWKEQAWLGIAADFDGWRRLMGNKLTYLLNAYEVPNNRNYYFSKRFASLLTLPLLGFGAIFPLAVLGLVVSWRALRKQALIVLFATAHVAALLTFFVNGRYRLVLVPVLLLWAAAALRWLLARARRAWLDLRIAPDEADARSRRADLAALGIAAAGLLIGYAVVHQRVAKIDYRANFVNLGNAYRDRGDLERAVVSYDQALEVAPSSYFALFKKGEVLARLDRKQEAIDSLRTAATMARRNGDRLNLGRINRRLQKLGVKLPARRSGRSNKRRGNKDSGACQ